MFTLLINMEKFFSPCIYQRYKTKIKIRHLTVTGNDDLKSLYFVFQKLK